MVYSFKPRFVPLIESGQKLTTIRAPRKDGKLPKPGEVITLATGMRTKHYRVIGQRVCLSVKPISIRSSGGMVWAWINGRAIGDHARLAQKDGFKTWAELVEFFSTMHDLPFNGHLIEWAPSQA